MKQLLTFLCIFACIYVRGQTVISIEDTAKYRAVKEHGDTLHVQALIYDSLSRKAERVECYAIPADIRMKGEKREIRYYTDVALSFFPELFTWLDINKEPLQHFYVWQARWIE